MCLLGELGMLDVLVICIQRRLRNCQLLLMFDLVSSGVGQTQCYVKKPFDALFGE